jgi:site-specific DNA-methyltransferase (adenine-specific)
MSRLTKQLDELIAGKRRHLLIQGDCLDFGRQAPAEIFDSGITDPPYGMSYQGKDNKRDPIANDKRPFIWWLNDAYRMLKPDAALACFCQWKGQEDFKTAIRLAGFDVRSHVIWDRLNGGMGATHCTFAPRHDVVWFATKGRFSFPNGRPDSVLPHANVPTMQRLHSTQKPLDLMTKLITKLTPKGGIVYDPCMGSGSTGEAAIAAGYRFVGCELDPANYANAKRRIERALRGGNAPKAKFCAPIHYTPCRRAVA